MNGSRLNLQRVDPEVGDGSFISSKAELHYLVRVKGKATLGHFVIVDAPVLAEGDLSIGHYTLINEPLITGENVFLGARVTVDTRTKLEKNCQVQNGVEFKRTKQKLPITIGEDTRILTNAILYEGMKVGRESLIADGARIRDRSTLGNNVIVGAYSEIGADVKIGNDVKIQTYAFVPDFCEVGDGAYLGPNVIMTNTVHPRCEKLWECIQGKAARVEPGAIIGAGSVLLPGSVVEEGAVVGAGSIVSGVVGAGRVYRMRESAKHTYKGVERLMCKSGILGEDVSPYRRRE